MRLITETDRDGVILARFCYSGSDEIKGFKICFSLLSKCSAVSGCMLMHQFGGYAELAPDNTRSLMNGDSAAVRIIEAGAEHLHQLYVSVVKRLDFTEPPVMFAGGLLSSDTLLRHLLMQKIGLNNVPSPKYSPVAGAALMAYLSNS